MREDTGGRNDAEADIKNNPKDRLADNPISHEAEELKRGGKAGHKKDCKCGRCSGGRAMRKRGGPAGKMVDHMEGEKGRERADRKPRKNGGRTGADGSPFSSARHGTVPPGRKVDGELD